jgi:alpha-ketoglutarate-dependent 2,4-dichlorophenoxyacetate dioxygenase
MVARSVIVNPLHPIFGAELIGADLRQPPSDALVRLVRRAMDEYAVLVIRDQRISDDDHIRFSRAFGPLELPPNLGLRDYKRRLRRELYDASNLDANGAILALDSERRTYNRGNELFHTDSSFNDLPTSWSLLLAHELPPSGGNTDFVDTRAVYDDQPEARKQAFEGLIVEHWLWHSRERSGMREFTEEMRRLMPPARHPLVRTLPSGRKALYIGAHASHIVDWPVEQGRALLDELYQLATQPKYVYSHVWRPGDLVIWDNRCTMHRAGDYDDVSFRRDLRRTTVLEYGEEQASTDRVQLAQSVD